MLRSRSLALGAVIAGVATSSCCILPMLLALLGAGGAGLGSALAPYRPLFFGITVVLVAIALWIAHRPGTPTSEQAEDCCARAPARLRRWPTWLMSAFALGVAALPFAMDGSAGPSGDCKDRLELRVSGMTCAGCEVHITTELLGVPGVTSAGANYERGTAWACLLDPVTNESLVAAVERAGYTANVVASPVDEEKIR